MKKLVAQLMITIAILRKVENVSIAQGKGVQDGFRQFGVVCKMHLELVLDTFSSFQTGSAEQKKFKRDCVLAGYVTGLASVKHEIPQQFSTQKRQYNMQCREKECTRKVNLLRARYPHTKHTRTTYIRQTQGGNKQ